MFESLSPLKIENLFENSLPVCVSFCSPFLDSELENVPSEYIYTFMELALTIMLLRQDKTTILPDDDLDPDKTDDDYKDDAETLEINTVLTGVVDHDLELLSFNNPLLTPEELDAKAVELTTFYEGVIRSLVTKLFDDLIYDALDDVTTTLEILQSCYERTNQIRIQRLKYYPENHKVWLVLMG